MSDPIKEYKSEKNKDKIELAKKRTATEGSYAKGGLVKKGKPKIAKKGWR